MLMFTLFGGQDTADRRNAPFLRCKQENQDSHLTLKIFLAKFHAHEISRLFHSTDA